MIIEKTIFAFKGMLLEPKKGLEIRNADSLIEHKKKPKR